MNTNNMTSYHLAWLRSSVDAAVLVTRHFARRFSTCAYGSMRYLNMHVADGHGFVDLNDYPSSSFSGS